MTRSLIFAMLFAALPVVLPAAAQDLEVSPVAGSIHMISGQGGNIGVSAGADGFLMVDDKFAPLADQIRAQLEGLGEGELKFLLNTHFHGDHTGGNEVAGSIHMISGQGGNIGVSAGADGFLMVDDKFAPLADQIRAQLEGLGEGELKFLLNTHFHGDHTGGNEVFGVETPIIAHHNVRARLMSEQGTPPASPAALPVITFDNALSIHFNGEEVKVLHVPHAHTDGDALIFFTGSNVVHMGDTFFNQRFPYVDIDSGGTVEGIVAAGRAVLAQVDAETSIIPGHGPIAAPSDLETYLRMIEETRAAIAAGVEAGQSLEELQAAGAGDEWASWGDGFISTERWIATLHRDLTE